MSVSQRYAKHLWVPTSVNHFHVWMHILASLLESNQGGAPSQAPSKTSWPAGGVI